MSKTKEKRCSWCLGSELYIDYHDNEWGVPCYDARALFEMLSLEGAQAGLSWITILNKRENYRHLFANFDAAKVARFTVKKIDKLVADSRIVRHRQKIEAVVANAKLVVQMEKSGESLTDFLWSFVDFRPFQNKHKTMATVQTRTEQSMLLSKALKKRGFKFVGGDDLLRFYASLRHGQRSYVVLSRVQNREISRGSNKTPKSLEEVRKVQRCF